ncbi:MAG: hypothetical protein ACOWWO_03035 [Peptococcaceae bacterium]
MNKIKLMYDVVKATKSKTVISGVLKVEACKSKRQVFALENEFEKDLTNGTTKAKIKTELDYEGRIVRHESSTEFNHADDCHFYGMRDKHHFHHRHFHQHNCGPQGKLAKMLFLLKALDDLKVTDGEDQGLLLTLDINEIPEDIKELMLHKHGPERFREGKEEGPAWIPGKHPEFGFCQDLRELEEPCVKLSIRVNGEKEITNISCQIEGVINNAAQEKENIELTADLSLL